MKSIILKTKNVRLVSAFFSVLLLSAISATAQRDGGQIKIPASLLVPKPVLEWQNFNVKTQQVNGVSVNAFRFGISNWKSFSSELFAAAPDLPACGSNKNASRTWLTIHDFQTD